MDSDLFRQEVLDSHVNRAYGNVVLLHPASHFILAGLGAGVLLMLGLFLFLGSYTRHAAVAGVLEPSGGLVKVYPGRIGRLTTSLLREGQAVRKGDVLLRFTSEHDGIAGQAVEARSEASLHERLRTLQLELQGTMALGQSDEASARESMQALQSVHDNLGAQIREQNTRIAAAQGVLSRFESLQKSGFLSEVQVQAKRDELSEQRGRLQILQRDLISNNAEIARSSHETASMPIRNAVARAQIERNIAATEAELGLAQNAHDWTVTAPCDGVVSSLTVTRGQTVDGGTLLLTLLPQANVLQATLYASSRDLGFIKPGQAVKMKLEAFPYQKFGLANGRVVSIANSPVLAGEVSLSTHLPAAGDKSEPQYAIQVALDKQTIDAYGQPQALRSGMQLAADIQLDQRRLYEWLFEPLYGFKHN